MTLIRPFFPPEYVGPPVPPTFPVQPGLLLPLLTVVVVAALVARELVGHRMRPVSDDPDDLEITWLPVDAVELARADYEELTNTGPVRMTRPHRMPFEH